MCFLQRKYAYKHELSIKYVGRCSFSITPFLYFLVVVFIQPYRISCGWGASSRPPSTFSGPAQTTKELGKTAAIPPASASRKRQLAIENTPIEGKQFDPKFTSVGALTNDIFINKLLTIEPEHFGGKALGALIPRGKRAHCRVELNRVFTFSTGREAHHAIEGDEVSEDVFAANIKEETKFRGHRGRGLPLGNIDWERDGLCTWSPKRQTVSHRFTGEEYHLTKEDLAKISNVMNVKLLQNWSETTYQLKEVGKKWSLLLSSVFSNQQATLKAQPTKRIRLFSKVAAIADKDESAETPPSPTAVS